MFDIDFEAFFSNNIAQILGTIVITVLLQILIRHTIARIIKRAVRATKFEHKVDEEKREKTLTSVFRTAFAIILWTFAIIIMLLQLDVNFAPLLTGAGLFGIVLGLAAQNMLKDYFAGILIIFENQYRVGDIVKMGTSIGPEVAGVVEDISIRITRLRDLDGNMHIVPNGSVGVVTNMSFKFANVNVDIGVSYDTDIDKAMKVINEVGEAQLEDERHKDAIYEPIQFLRVDKFGDFAIMLKCVGKVQPAMQWDVAGDFRHRIKKAFEKHNIEIPIPKMEVYYQLPVEEKKSHKK